MATDRLFNHSQGERLISAIEKLADCSCNAVGTRGERNGWSAILNLNYSNPISIVTYADRAEGMLRGWEHWKNTDLCKDIRPCVLRDGVVQYYLDPDDYTKKEDGTPADITTIGDDVMVEFPFMGYKIRWIDETAKIAKVTVTLEPHCEDFCYAAFSCYYNSDCDKVYVGAYDGYNDSNKIYSVSGVNPNSYTYRSYNAINTHIYARGDRYTEYTFTMHTLIQCLYILVFGNLDSQTTIGKGLAGSRNITTGVSNAYGFCNEYSPDKESTSYAIKCFGIENLWGGANANNTYSLNTFLYGVNTNGNTKNISVIPFARANVREAYSYPSTVFGAWLTAPIGVSLFGFFQNMNIDTHGSAGTYFSDYVSLFSSADNQTYYYCVGRGVTNTVGEYGIFSLSQFIGGSSGSGSIVISSRLMYMRERII